MKSHCVCDRVKVLFASLVVGTTLLSSCGQRNVMIPNKEFMAWEFD
ncbi:MAG TPA: hypothetical protein PKA78_13100 [Macellibacteroides fermentans]|nr:hypothetical protein [Macellibacteroides fermentans]